MFQYHLDPVGNAMMFHSSDGTRQRNPEGQDILADRELRWQELRWRSLLSLLYLAAGRTEPAGPSDQGADAEAKAVMSRGYPSLKEMAGGPRMRNRMPWFSLSCIMTI